MHCLFLLDTYSLKNILVKFENFLNRLDQLRTGSTGCAGQLMGSPPILSLFKLGSLEAWARLD